MKPPRKTTRRGPAKGQGGRPKGPAKIKLTVMVLPETRAALGDRAGETIDRLVARLG